MAAGALAVLLSAVLAACGGSGDTPSPETDEPGATPTGQTGGTDTGQPSSPSSPGAEETVIVISDFAYDVPTSVTAGGTVTVRNEDPVAHTVTSDEPGVFDVAVGPGEEVEMTAPASGGDYPFHCTPHPNMTATLTVR
ncbi:cupredoxin domain-containing protein [Puerhibacterium sp. TATVAM-FAB25]|uniref:cupredoxin domain-containing protein n=1 Tax=Puerhibacterium sp. TATVAM-FAB25 TaxID=3093699 RepID=UPI00397CEE52